MSSVRWAPAFVLLLGVVVPVTAEPLGAGAQTPSCGTSSPIAVVDGGPHAPGSPGTNRVMNTGDIAYPRTYGPEFPDTNLDGALEEAHTQADGSVTVIRPDGTIRFAQPGVPLWAGAIGYPADPQVDHGHDLGVFPIDDVGRGIGPSYIVSGAIAPGSYDPRVAGVGVGEGTPVTTADRDGDHIADILVIDFVPGDNDNGRTKLVSGAAVAAAAPGDDVSGAATFGDMPGSFLGYARVDGLPPFGIDMGDPRGGRIVTISQAPTAITLHVGDGTQYAALTTTPEVFDSPSPGNQLFAWTSDDGPFISLTTAGPTTYWWALSDCGAVPTSSTDAQVGHSAPTYIAPATTAPPAQPSDVDPDFTG